MKDALVNDPIATEATGSAHPTEILRRPIGDRSAWRRDDMLADDSWLHQLNAQEIRDVESAILDAKKQGIAPSQLRKTDFPLPTLGPALSNVADELEDGRGLVALRGLPVGTRDIGELELMCAGISSHFGQLVVQDINGTLIDHVYDRGLSFESVAVRGYTTNAELTPHCDSGDIIGLLCVRPARSGGINSLASSISIYNEILETHPEYLEVLYAGFHYNLRGSGTPGDWVNLTRHRVPAYSYYKGKLSCRFNQKAIKTAEDVAGIQPLTAMERAAVDYVAGLAGRPELRFDIQLKSGDFMMANNHTVFHTRAAFTDHEDPDLKRLLLRVWINVDNPRELTGEFSDHYNTGPRQGPYVHNSPATAHSQ